LALVGLVLLRKRDSELAVYFGICTAVFVYVVSCYANWDGISSFGNRFFLSLGPVFIVGLAAFFERASRLFRSERQALCAATAAVALLAAWNIGFIFQWGAHMVPVRGPISWPLMLHNQFTEVPARIWSSGEMYFLSRNRLLRQIEERDLEELKKSAPESH